MAAVHPEASRQAVVEAALVLLERMGLTPGGPGRCPAASLGGANVRRVRTRGIGGGKYRDPAGVWFVLEPGHRALGQPTAGRANAVGDPAADGLRQDPRGGPPQRPRRT